MPPGESFAAIKNVSLSCFVSVCLCIEPRAGVLVSSALCARQARRESLHRRADADEAVEIDARQPRQNT
jgi:hypothetical protein